MATFVSVLRFTDQGARNFQDTQKRAADFRAGAEKAGVTVREQYWMLGRYDGLLVLDAPDEETVTALMVALGALGNVRTQTMRAFDENEIGSVLERARSRGTGAGGGGRSKR
jgi:uncharacterized protein with GYD domain